MTDFEYDEDQFEEVDPEEELFEEAETDFEEEPDELDELSREFVKALINKIMAFMEMLVGYKLHSYQEPLARRIIESVIINDGEEVTALASRQSGKSEQLLIP
jgi:hypothetical protein